MDGLDWIERTGLYEGEHLIPLFFFFFFSIFFPFLLLRLVDPCNVQKVLDEVPFR